MYQKDILIEFSDYTINGRNGTSIKNLSWKMCCNEVWLVTGTNGSGKSAFLEALENPEEDGFCSVFFPSTFNVSLEKAAAILEEERKNDDSEYSDDGVDCGRTGRFFIAQNILETVNKNLIRQKANEIDNFPEITLCGIQNILDRGLKFMSTGELRRTLLASALISHKKLLILDNPFAGLDIQSRKIFYNFFSEIAKRQTSNLKEFPYIIIAMDRYEEIPEGVTNVLEFTDNKVSFCGKQKAYEEYLAKIKQKKDKQYALEKENFYRELKQLYTSAGNVTNIQPLKKESSLIEMENVNVSWDNHKVLRDINWTLNSGEHFLIRGPNGSGKTTLLELITGDNMQVFCNNVKLFGKRRGSGETIWDIKSKLGIVSHRLHVEYRMIKSISIQNTVISGFYDSIGLYTIPTDMQIAIADKWLKLGGFAERKLQLFDDLSYGEQRAVLILRAAVKCPKILILDEPCYGLDEFFRQKILDLLEIIADSGTTTLLHVTHEPSEVLTCEKKILELCPDKNPMFKIIENKERLQ